MVDENGIQPQEKILRVLRKSKDFYEAMFECSGGCDHSVGICECADRADYDELCKLVAWLTPKVAN